MILQTIEFPRLPADIVIDVRVVQVVPVPQIAHIPVVVQRLVPLVLLFSRPRDSAVARRHGGRSPRVAGGASSTCAVVEKTVGLPQLHLLRNSLRSQTLSVSAPQGAAHDRGDELVQAAGLYGQTHISSTTSRWPALLSWARGLSSQSSPDP